ncbi:hypothetical protein HXX76_009516 [Chlamydomonas incerta]|uniref:Uncharacterized protein n=1 Tax=Chlamydomonas incerta TaxID=51695 RepID=A0A835VW24_CHLIN|nr:hypothetical protein HXX76_009516 [Chlamydomonas incerta]|eukprot:KAG2431502.1 hypothetical protein HXX76_009516 [Chlamydomonas incerta]
MGSDKQMDSKSTAKLVKTRVCQHLKLSTIEQQVEQLLGRMDGQDSQIRELQAASSAQLATHRELQAASSAQLATHRELQAASSAQLATHRELQAASSAQLATHRELQATSSAQLATNRELQAEHSELRGRVDVLASQIAAHSFVLRRDVVDLAHQKLEQRFDCGEDSRPPDMLYSAWLAALQARHPQYFQQHRLDAPAIQLLHKGRGTPSHAGSLAAHQPPQAHVDAALADELAWDTLWAFVTSPER